MHSDRIFGIGASLFGVLLLLVLIPDQVSEGRGYTDPSRFPRIAAWLFIGLGALHAVISTPGMAFPLPREGSRMALVFAAAFIVCLLMPIFGYLTSAIAFMAVMTLLMFERRPHWAGLTILAIPSGLFAFFVLLLGRPLPTFTLF